MAIGKADVLTRLGVVALTTPPLALYVAGLPVDIAKGRLCRPPKLRLFLSINIASLIATRTEAQYFLFFPNKPTPNSTCDQFFKKS